MGEEKAISNYFQSIYDQLKTIEKSVFQLSISSEEDEEDPQGDQLLNQLKLLKMDFFSLKMFCLCLEKWDFTADKQGIEEWQTIISFLQKIELAWQKEHKGLTLLKRFAESRGSDMSIQDFHSVRFELERTIQHSKQRIKGWCEMLMNSTMRFKASTYSETSDFLQHLRKNLNKFSKYRAAEIVPLKKQTDMLDNKILFLEELLDGIKSCPNSIEIIRFRNFICSFATDIACLTCLYWAKETNYEIANEMNKVIFEMLKKFIPSSSDITLLYIGILKSYNLQPTGTFILEEAGECFVDFFFEHFHTILKDDFPIIRDGMIFLFTFLTDPPCENVEEEKFIRRQIDGLFRKGEYFLLSFHGMKDDISNEKRLLSEFKFKIDMAITNIRQLHCGFSDSEIRLEVEKMEYIYFVSVHRELTWIEKFALWTDDSVLDQLRLYKMELRFLRVFLLCFATWDDTIEVVRVDLSPIITSFQEIWEEKEEKRLLAHRLYSIREGNITDWHLLASEFEEKLKLSKLIIKGRWAECFHMSFRCKPLISYKMLNFMDSILENLNDIYDDDEDFPFKDQIETLKEKLGFLNNFLKLAVNCKSNELGDLKMLVQKFSNDATCLTLLYWADEDENNEIEAETNSMLSHVLQKIKPSMPDVARLYFGTLIGIYVQRSDPRVFGQLATNFVDFFLEDPVTPLKDDFQILRDDIIFLLIFLNNPPNENDVESICGQIDILFWEGLYGLFPIDDTEVDFLNKKALLNDFMTMIQSINANIRQIDGSSSST